MKKCTVCKEELPFESYHKSKLTKDGFGYRCIPCDRKARHKYREENTERFAEVNRRKQLKHRYNISLEEYEVIRVSQGCVCAICGSSSNGVSGKQRDWNWSVDHCHSTGKVRGLLCNSCNRGLGLLGDTVEQLEKALAYLKKNG